MENFQTGFNCLVEITNLSIFVIRYIPLIDRAAKIAKDVKGAMQAQIELREILTDIDIIVSTQTQILEIYKVILEELNKKNEELYQNSQVVNEDKLKKIRKLLNLRLFGMVYGKLMFLFDLFESLTIKKELSFFKKALRILTRGYSPVSISELLEKKRNVLTGYLTIQNQQLTWLVFICMTKYQDEWNDILQKLLDKPFFSDFITNSKITEEMVKDYFLDDFNVNRIEDDENFKFNSSTYKVKPNIHPQQATEQEANENYKKYKENLDKNKTFFSKITSLFTSNQGTGGAKQQKNRKTQKQQKQQKNRRPKKQKSKKQSKTKKLTYKNESFSN